MSSSSLPKSAYRRWLHSFEEDTGDLWVYRPVEYGFPLARRPRETLELKPDGTAVEGRPGRADAPQPFAGSWSVGEDSHVHLTFGDAMQGTTRLTVVEAQDDVLKVRVDHA